MIKRDLFNPFKQNSWEFTKENALPFLTASQAADVQEVLDLFEIPSDQIQKLLAKNSPHLALDSNNELSWNTLIDDLKAYLSQGQCQACINGNWYPIEWIVNTPSLREKGNPSILADKWGKTLFKDDDNALGADLCLLQKGHLSLVKYFKSWAEKKIQNLDASYDDYQKLISSCDSYMTTETRAAEFGNTSLWSDPEAYWALVTRELAEFPKIKEITLAGCQTLWHRKEVELMALKGDISLEDLESRVELQLRLYERNEDLSKTMTRWVCKALWNSVSTVAPEEWKDRWGKSLTKIAWRELWHLLFEDDKTVGGNKYFSGWLLRDYESFLTDGAKQKLRELNSSSKEDTKSSSEPPKRSGQLF